MTKHLSPEEFVDLLDHAPSGAADVHLQECDECRRELAAIKSMADEAAAVEAHEPSPLFWEHFSARVAQATAQVEPARPWWNFGWRLAATMAGAVLIVALAVVLRPVGNTPNSATMSLASADPTPDIEDDGSWSLVMGLASGVGWDELREAAAPAAGTADAAIAELDAAQREALVRLLKREIGEP